MLPITRDFTTEPHDLYHVSPKLFDFPCRKKIDEAREWSQWHANGVLGLWASTFPVMCKPFGKYVYRLRMKPEHRPIGLPFTPFMHLTSAMGRNDTTDWKPLIDFLCAEGDVAYLIDRNPHVGEVIVLNFDMVESFTNVTECDLRDQTVPLSLGEHYSALHD